MDLISVRMTASQNVQLSGLRRGELTTKLERYTIGSKTLNETKSVVDDLKACRSCDKVVYV